MAKSEGGRSLRRAHLLLGLATVVLFLGTGGYMRSLHLSGLPERVRYLYRASHVYLLFSGLLNILAGTYGRGAAPGWRGRVQAVGSLLLLLVPPTLFWAFLVEPPLGIPSRPRTLAGVIFALAGTVLHLLGGLPERSGLRGGGLTGAGSS